MSSAARNHARIPTDESTCGDASDCETDLNQAIYDPSSTETLESSGPPPSERNNYRQPLNFTTESSSSSKSCALTVENLREDADRTEQQEYDADFNSAMEKLSSLKLRKSPNRSRETVSVSKQASVNTSKSTSTILAGNMVEAPGVYRSANSRVSSMNSTIVAGRLLSSDSIDDDDGMTDSTESPLEPSNSLFNIAIEEVQDIGTLDSQDYTDSLEKCAAKALNMSSLDNEIRAVSADTLELILDNQTQESKSYPDSMIFSEHKDKDCLNTAAKSAIDRPRELPNLPDKIKAVSSGFENTENLDPQLGSARNKGDCEKPMVKSVETVLHPVKIMPSSLRKVAAETQREKKRDSNFNISSEYSTSDTSNWHNIDTTCSETEKIIIANAESPSKARRSIKDCHMSSPKAGVIHDSISSIDFSRISTSNLMATDTPRRGAVTAQNRHDEMNPAWLWSMLAKMDVNLSTAGKKSAKSPEKLISRLSEEFKAAPSNFTERLVTIIEESVIQTNREPEDDLDANMSRIMGNLMESYKGIENESTPEFAPSLCMNTPPTTGSAGVASRVSRIEEEDGEDAGQRCFEHEIPEPCSVEGKTFTVTPKVCRHQSPDPCSANGKAFTISPGFQRLAGSSRIYPRTPRSIYKKDSTSSENRTPGSVGSPAGGRTPRHGGNDSIASFLNMESWCKQMYSPERGTPKRRLQEQSPVVNSRPSRLTELIRIYERQAFANDSAAKETEAVDDEEAAGNLDPGDGSYLESFAITKKPGIDDEDELQRSLLAEVAEKRRRCFDTAKIIMEITVDPRVEVLKVPEGAARNDTLPETDSGFLSILSACTEYHTYINGKRNTLQTIIENSDQFKGGLRRAPVENADDDPLRKRRAQRNLCAHSRQNEEKRNPKDHRKIVDSPSEVKQPEPRFLRESDERKANGKDSTPRQKFGASPAKAKSVASIERSPRLKKPSQSQRTANRRSVSSRSPSGPRPNQTKSTSDSQRPKKTVQSQGSLKRRSLSPRSPIRSASSQEAKSVRQSREKLSALATTTPTTPKQSNVSHRRLQSRLGMAFITNKTNTANGSPSSPHLAGRNQNFLVPFLKVTAPTPDKKFDDAEDVTSSYADLEQPRAEKKDCPTPQADAAKKKFFFTPGKSPTYGKVKRKPQSYFAPVKKTPSRQPSPIGKGSQLQRVYRTCDSTRTVISPVAMYIKGANAPLVRNVPVSTNERMLTPTRRKAKVQKTPTESHSPILARSPRISDDSRLNFALSPQERCGRFEVEDGAETRKNAASTCVGVGSTAEGEFKLPRISYRAAPLVIMADKTEGVPQTQLVKGVWQPTVIRHAGRMKSAHLERGFTADNSATDSMQHDAADISIREKVSVEKSNYIGTKRAA